MGFCSKIVGESCDFRLVDDCFEEFYLSWCVGVVDAVSLCGFGEDFHGGLMMCLYIELEILDLAVVIVSSLADSKASEVVGISQASDALCSDFQ